MRTHLAIATLAALSSFTPAEAVVINATTTADWRTDLRVDPPNAAINGYAISAGGYGCGACGDPENYFAPGASLGLLFGSTLGGSDLGIAYMTNGWGIPIDNQGAQLSNWIFVPGDLDYFYTRAFYVDDVLDVGALSFSDLLFGSHIHFYSADLCAPDCPAPRELIVPPLFIPLPASLLLLLTGLLALCGIDIRRKSCR